ncbi:hypothetical protein ACFP3Q_11410 [Nocardioides sp. GCM10027113]|uniref:hypothetical protein n=1 Tax=unclassified Nocardioides TaxID=2615069 RepID=UPI00360AC1EF
MTSQQRPRPSDWQWDDSQWSDRPAAPTSPDRVPDPDDDRPGWLRRLLRWAERPT